MKRTLLATAVLCLLAFPVALVGQVVTAISGMAISQYGQPSPFATIRVCLVTSSGTPCTTSGINLYYDYGQTIPAPNPYSSDQYGNYSFYATGATTPNVYLIEVTPAPPQTGGTFTYLFNGAGSSGGGGSPPAPPSFAVQIANLGVSSFLADPNILENTTTHTLTSPNFNSPNRQYQNSSHDVDAVADCGLVGDGTTDNAAALTACYTAHPHTRIFFPPLNGATNTQAIYYLSTGTVVPSANSLESAGWAYQPNNVQGAILKCPATVNCVQLSQNAAIQNINVIGSEPSSTSTIDPQNILFPAGSTLAEYHQPILEIGVTSGVMTLAFYPPVPALWRVGGAVQVNLPSPYAALSGTYYVQTVIGGYGTVGSSTYPYTQITVNVPGAGNQTLTMINGTCPTGCVMPATTGASNSVGIRIAGTFTTVHNVYVANFARAGIETDGQDFTADDPDIENAIVYGNRGYGYFSVGGDSNVANLRHVKAYFNGMYGFMDVSFLHNYYESPQTTCNGNCQETVGGPQIPISSISRTCSGYSCTISGTTSTAHGFSVGNGVFIQGVSDTTFNTPTAISNTVGCFIATVPALNQFTCSQPTYTVALSNATSSGGSVALGSAFQVYTGSAMDTGSYAFGHNTTFANHFVIMNPYAEGGQGEYDPFHCSIVANSGTMILQAEFGDCINQTALPSITQAYGALGWQFTPFTVVQGGGQGTQSAAFSPETQLLTGFGSDASSMLGFNDFLCANLNPVGGFPGCGVDNRFTDPGQNDSWYGMRVTVSADQPGQYNYPALFGYGATKQSGETTAIGSAAFTGTGLNDATSGGSATSTNEQTYVASICGTGTPDSWTYSTATMGPIATLTLNTGGSAYQVGEWVTVNSTGAPGTLSAIIQVDSLGGGGAISTFHIIPGQNGINFTIQLNNTTTALYGFMSSYAIGRAGTGYHPGDTGFVAAGNNSIQNTYVVNTVNGSGGVTGITITNVTGAQYGIFTNKPTSTGGAQPGTGSGLAINITGVQGSGATVNILSLTNGSACATMAAGGSPNNLVNGVTITWAASTGHTLADKWSIPLTVTLGQRPPAWFPNGFRMGNSTWNAGPRKFVECSIATTPASSCSPDGNFALGDVAFNDGFLSTTTPAFWCSASHTSGSTSICDTWVGLGSGGGGGGTVTGTGTTNTLAMWTSGTAIGNAPLTVSGGNVSSSDPVIVPSLTIGSSGTQAQQLSTGWSNDTSTGTVALHFAKIVGTTAIETGTGDTAVKLFVIDTSTNWPNSSCVNGTSGQSCLLLSIPGTAATVTFDAGGATINHYVGQSTTTAGDAKDLGTTVTGGVACFGQATAAVAGSATGLVAVGVCPPGS